MNLTKKRYYQDGFEEREYVESQIKRHYSKKTKVRKSSHYKKSIKKNFGLIPSGSKMLCLGTRNNYERDVWKGILAERGVEVSSLDISKGSVADYIMDFQKLPKDWDDKWDVIFSNSIDHAANPESTLLKWLKIIRIGGVAILGFDLSDHDGTTTDCSVFDGEGIEEFFVKSNVEIICRSNVETYVYYTIKRIK